MRKIVNSTYISLDGMIEAPHTWPPTGPDDEASGTIQTELLLACDAVLMGRRTYEGFAPVWPTWSNTTVIDGDPIDEIKRLKSEPGNDKLRDTTPLKSGSVILGYAAAS